MHVDTSGYYCRLINTEALTEINRQFNVSVSLAKVDLDIRNLVTWSQGSKSSASVASSKLLGGRNNCPCQLFHDNSFLHIFGFILLLV